MKFFKKISKKNKIIFLMVLGSYLLIHLYMYITVHSIRYRYITLEFEDLPKSFDNIKIALSADMHAGLYIPQSHIRKMSDMIMNEKPDIILFVGDYIYSSPHKFTYYNSKNTEKFHNGITNLEAKYGKYSVMGNHDNWENFKDVSNSLYSNGFNLIDNSISFITNESGDYISIGGVGDYLTDDVKFDLATSNVNVNDFHILLSHEPNMPLKISKKKGYDKFIDLFLSGHMHGFQISIFPMWFLEALNKNRDYPLIAGVYGKMKYGNIQVFITSGIGAVIVPFRLFAYPEVVIITLKSK